MLSAGNRKGPYRFLVPGGVIQLVQVLTCDLLCGIVVVSFDQRFIIVASITADSQGWR